MWQGAHAVVLKDMPLIKYCACVCMDMLYIDPAHLQYCRDSERQTRVCASLVARSLTEDVTFSKCSESDEANLTSLTGSNNLDL